MPNGGACLHTAGVLIKILWFIQWLVQQLLDEIEHGAFGCVHPTLPNPMRVFAMRRVYDERREGITMLDKTFFSHSCTSVPTSHMPLRRKKHVKQLAVHVMRLNHQNITCKGNYKGGCFHFFTYGKSLLEKIKEDCYTSCFSWSCK